MPTTQANEMRYVVGQTNRPIEELQKYKYCRFYRYTISNSELALKYYGVRVEVSNEDRAEAAACVFDVLFNNAETADSCYSYLLTGSTSYGSIQSLMRSGPISSDQECTFTKLKKNWSSMAMAAQDGCQWFNSEKWYLSVAVEIQYLISDLKLAPYHLRDCISILSYNLGPFGQIEEEIFMDLTDEDKQPDRTDPVTDKKKEPEQKFLPLDEFMKLRYKEIYGRRPEPSDIAKVIPDVMALSNTQILNGDYEWWELTQVVSRLYNVPLLEFSKTSSLDGAVNIGVLSNTVIAQLVSLYGTEKVLGVSALAHRLNIIASR